MMVISIPLYFVRIPLFSTSISILTIFLCVVCIVLFFYYHNDLRITTTHKKNFWFLVLIFVLSFVPLLWHAPVHSYGVFIEWIFLPALTSFLLSHHVTHSGYAILQKSILLIFFLTISWALLLLCANIMTYDGRLGTSFLSPNQLAIFLTPLFFIVASMIYTTKEKTVRSFLIFLLFSSLIVLFLTYSFSEFFAVSNTILVLIFILSRRRMIIIYTLLILCIIGSFFLYQKMIHSDQIFERNSLSSRIMIWDFSVYHIQKFPLIGSGIDGFQTSYLDAQPYFTPYLEWAVPTPHNLFLTLWISGGFFTFYTFLLLCVYTLYSGLVQYKKYDNPVLLFFCAALLSIILSGILDTPYWKNDLAIIFWIIVALIESQLLSPPHTQDQ